MASLPFPPIGTLTGAEIELVSLPERERRLGRFLAPLRDQFDSIFIDCPPSLGLLTLNALVAADAVLIPLHCEYFALEGLADLVATLRRVRASLNPSLDIDGVLLTMHDERTNLRSRSLVTFAPSSRRRCSRRPSRATSASRGAQPWQARGPVRREVARRRRHTVGARRDGRRACSERAGSDAATLTRKQRLSRGSPEQRQTLIRSQERMDQSEALGKGLSALIPDAPEPQAATIEVDVDLLRPNSYQPRLRVDDARLDELAQSIRTHGVIQPIVVAPASDDGVPDHRRRTPLARRAAGRPPSRARRRTRRGDAEDRHDMLEMALIENIQRENLNAIEEGHRVPAAGRRVPPDAGRHRRRGWQGSRRRSPTWCGCSSCPTKCARRSPRGAFDGTCARAARAADRGRAAHARARHHRAQPLGARNRRPGQEGHRRRASAAPANAPKPADVHTRAAEEKLRLQLGTRVRIVRKREERTDRNRVRQRTGIDPGSTKRIGRSRIEPQPDRGDHEQKRLTELVACAG